MGSKVGDEQTVSLRRIHLRALHDAVDELSWWSQFEVDPVEAAERLWAHGTKTLEREKAGEGILGNEPNLTALSGRPTGAYS